MAQPSAPVVDPPPVNRGAGRAMVGAGLLMTAVGVCALRGHRDFLPRVQGWVENHRIGAVMAGVATTVVAEHAVNNLSTWLFDAIGRPLPTPAREHSNNLGRHTRGAWSNRENFRDSGPFGKLVNVGQMGLNLLGARRAARGMRGA